MDLEIYFFDSHVITIILLLVFSSIILVKSDRSDFRNTLMIQLMYISVFLLVIEIITFLVNGEPGIIMFYVNYVSNVLLILLPFVILFIFTCYVDYNLYESVKRLKTKLYYVDLLLPISILIIINFFTPILFSIDSTNTFSKDSLNVLILCSFFFVYLQMGYLAYQNRTIIKKSLTKIVFMFGFVPVVLEVLENFVGELPYTYIGVSFVIIFTYLSYETSNKNKDQLTGLNTRISATNYIDTCIQKNKAFCVIILDLNNFKKLNDTYGHFVGDLAIIDFSKKIERTFRSYGVVSRLGGDEFIVVLGTTNNSLILYQINQLNRIIKTGNQVYSHMMGFSYGSIISYEVETLTPENLLLEADKRMYQNKAENKELRRRFDDR